MGDDYSASNRRRKAIRHAKEDPRPIATPAKKDTKKWCKGKVGREHNKVCVRKEWLPNVVWYVLSCTKCGKEFDFWMQDSQRFRNRKKPDWVKE